jgi:hypothetical protein
MSDNFDPTLLQSAFSNVTGGSPTPSPVTASQVWQAPGSLFDKVGNLSNLLMNQNTADGKEKKISFADALSAAAKNMQQQQQQQYQQLHQQNGGGQIHQAQQVNFLPTIQNQVLPSPYTSRGLTSQNPYNVQGLLSNG